MRSVLEGGIQAEFGDAAGLEEDDIEGIGRAVLGHAFVEPDLSRENVKKIFELLDRFRFAQDDVDAAHVGAPSGCRRVPPIPLVGVGNAAVVLVLEFVLGCPGGRIALLPESGREDIPVPVGIELQEDVPFLGCDDVDDVLLEPLAVLGRKILDALFLGLARRGKGGQPDEEKKDYGENEEATYFHLLIINRVIHRVKLRPDVNFFAARTRPRLGPLLSPMKNDVRPRFDANIVPRKATSGRAPGRRPPRHRRKRG